MQTEGDYMRAQEEGGIAGGKGLGCFLLRVSMKLGSSLLLVKIED
jgi:hypothetical protein